MLVITLTYVRPLAEVDALMPRHVAWLERHYKSGEFIASGRQVPRLGGIILARSGDLELVHKTLRADPFVRQGLATFVITEFTPSMTAPGAEVLLTL